MVGWGCANWVSGWGSVECCGRIEVWRVGEGIREWSVDGWMGVWTVGWWTGVLSVK